MQTINWGIIGVGDVCEVKSGPAFYKSSASSLISVMRRQAEKAQDFAHRHHVPHFTDNAEELLARNDIDAVYIATPPAQHQAYAIAALNAGKHVYIEKPVTLNANEVDAIIAAEQASGKKACVAHYRRAVPCFVEIQRLLKSGAIGRPLLVQLDMLQSQATKLIAASEQNWRIDPAISGGSLFHDLSPHQLDLVLHWFGSVVQAQGCALNQTQLHKADDLVVGWAQLESGVVFQGRWHFAVAENQTKDLCEIIGTHGSLRVNFFGQQVIQLTKQSGTREIHIPNPEHIQQPFIEQVNNYFRGIGDNPCSLQEARAVMALMDCFIAA